METRWGICGAGKISSDFCLSLKALPESEHQIVAIAASSKDKAAKFAADFGIPDSFGSYEDLGKQKNIDVVYVGTIHTLHVETCLMLINAGKNVLCEKPMALSLDGCKRVLKAAKEKGVFFAEGTWSRYFPAYDEIRNQLKKGALGDVKFVQASFCMKADHVPRLIDLKLGGGALMDVGLYTVQIATLVFKGKPEEVVAKAALASTGADLTGTVLLKYKGGAFAQLAFSCEMANQQNSVVLRGTEGSLSIPNHFWSPTQLVMTDGSVKEFPLPEVKEEVAKYNFDNGQGMIYQAQAVRECLLKGLKESPKMSHTDSETIMEILQQSLDQIGVHYQHP